MTFSPHSLQPHSCIIMMDRNDVAACSIALLTLLLMRIWTSVNRTQRNPKSLPLHPGPKPLPILGNILDIPRGEYSWIRIAEWRKLYGTNTSRLTYFQTSNKAHSLYSGDVTRVYVLGRETLFVNSWNSANDLLEKRSSIYSDRPELTMLNEMWGSRP